MGDGLIKVDQNFRNQQIALLRACQFDHGANDIVIGRTGACGDGFGVIEDLLSRRKKGRHFVGSRRIVS
jgi:hypothetical protein